jgi:CHAT domain-containing protein/Tfp pilus assembly protein PilF
MNRSRASLRFRSSSNARAPWLLALVLGSQLIAIAPGLVAAQPAEPLGRAGDVQAILVDIQRLKAEARFAGVRPLAERLLELREHTKRPEYPDTADALNILAEAYVEEGLYERAEPLLQRSLAICEKAVGEMHPAVADVRDRMGALYVAKGEYSLAEPLLQRALTIKEALRGSARRDLGATLNALGALYRERGEYVRAEEVLRRSLGAAEVAFGQDHPAIAIPLDYLGTLERLRGDYAQAEPLLRRALAIREKAFGHEHPAVATSAEALGRLYMSMDDDARAEPLLLRALAIRERTMTPEHPALASALDGIGRLYLSIDDDGVRAEPLLLRALAIREKTLGLRHPAVASSLDGMGALLSWQGEYQRSLQRHSRALEIREHVLPPGHPDIGSTLDALGSLDAVKGDYGRAEEIFHRALAIREKALGPWHRTVAASLQHLGGFYAANGDRRRAEPLLRRALAIREKALDPERPTVAESLESLGHLYRAMGDPGRAEPLLRRAMTIRAAAQPSSQVASCSLGYLASLHLSTGAYTSAESLFQQELAKQQRSFGAAHPRVTWPLVALANTHEEMNDYALAEPLLHQVLEIREQALGLDHPDVADALDRLAWIHRVRKDHVRAEALYRRALAIWEAALGPRHPDVARALNGLARVYGNERRASDSMTTMNRAAAIQEYNASIVLSAGSEEKKRSYLAPYRRFTDEAVFMHARGAPKSPEAAALAVTTVLRRKGRILDAMSDGFAALRASLSTSDQQILDELAWVDAELSRLLLHRSSRISVADYHARIDALDKRRGELEAAVSGRSTRFQAARLPVNLKQIQEAIPAGSALVEVYRYQPFRKNLVRGWDEDRYIAYILRHDNDIAGADLGAAAPIDAAVERLRRALADPSRDPIAPARDLDAKVMEPLRKFLGDTRWIFLSPDGALNLVPFYALVDETGRHLLHRYSFTYLTSGRDLVRFETAAVPRQGPVVIADPAFDLESVGRAFRSRRSADMDAVEFPPLPSTAEEARDVGHELAATAVLTGKKATEAALKALHGPSILHVATHGFFLSGQVARAEDPSRPPQVELGATSEQPAVLDVENPLLRSGLALAGANSAGDGTDDGILTALEASNLDLFGTRLVVLSACETGVGKASNGDGVYGLRRALVMAGAETQVMSLWRVDDEATRVLMTDYYKRLQAGGGRSEAMREVQVSMASRKATAHPYYWASFIVSGKGSALDGHSVVPNIPKVPPGPRGCSCHQEGGGPGADPEGLAVSLVVLVAVTRKRGRRGSRLRRCLVSAASE